MDLAPLALSFQVAFAATAACAIVGTAIGAILARPSTPWRDVFDVVFTAPLVLPPTVLGYYDELYKRDPVTVMALVQIFESRGNHGKTIRLLEPWAPGVFGKYKDPMLESLERAYQKTNDPLKAAEIRRSRLAR